MSQSDLPPPGGTMTVTYGFDRKVKVPMWDEHAMRAYAAAAVRAEREACAQLAESTVCDTHLPTGVRIYGTRAAAAIRARTP